MKSNALTASEAVQHSAGVVRDPGSFRDPDGYVFRCGRDVYRAVLPSAVERWRQFVASGLFAELQQAGLLVRTEEVVDPDLKLAAALPDDAIVLQHLAIPFLSYPYEWTFSMLRDAALLHLDILERSLARNWILKDATAYNVQFLGPQPVFLDVLSFAPLGEGEPWAGYNQFCRTMLYPLMLSAYKHVPFQPWLRSELEGIDPVAFSRMFRGVERMRSGVLSHVTAQAYLQRKFSSADYSVRDQLRSAGISSAMILRNIRKLKKLVSALKNPQEDTAWSGYSRSHYQVEALEQKKDFVRSVLGSRSLGQVWDLGCNDGLFSRIAGKNARLVVAMDADTTSIDGLYRGLREEKSTAILPLLMNLANQSPSQGWASQERRSLLDRGRPDLTLALALVHHLAISANIPLPAIVQWFGQTTRELITEFIAKDDPMVQRLLLNKDDTYDSYDRAVFEEHLKRHFKVVRQLELPGGSRFLYHAVTRTITN